MKIAVPTKDNQVDSHFGHCEYYTVFTIKENKIISKQIVPSPQGCGCKSNIAPLLSQMGVEVMLAGNMGEGAKNVLEKNNISIIRGCSGLIEEVVMLYINGSISDSQQGCSHNHNGEHQCHNH